MKGTLGITACVAALMAANAATAQELVIWHDKGDDGLAMIEEMSALFEAQHPGVTVTSLSYPTEQWFNRSIAGLNTNTGPDILFNDNNRIATIQQSTGRLCSVADLVDALPEGDRAYITDGDIAASTLEGDIIMMPFQRVVIGWG
ncbi:MAG: ABC transporter substrate-binding protein, partial [Pseudomonadota bacterium]